MSEKPEESGCQYKVQIKDDWWLAISRDGGYNFEYEDRALEVAKEFGGKVFKIAHYLNTVEEITDAQDH